MTTKATELPKMVMVVWEDAADLDGTPWAENKPMVTSEPMLFTTIGFLFYQDEERLVLTNSHGKELIGPRQQIPRGMVRSVKWLSIKR